MHSKIGHYFAVRENCRALNMCAFAFEKRKRKTAALFVYKKEVEAAVAIMAKGKRSPK